MYLITAVAALALLLPAAARAHAGATPGNRIVTGTVTCTVPYQVLMSPAGREGSRSAVHAWE
ncbi:MAG: hypothetical protein QGF68_20880 [Nitrospinota bacterium]|nr:hypothetical protein [Nitrospinota bacterium]